MHNEIWVYDPTTNTWTQSPTSLAMPRGYIATEAMPDGQIYLAGGSQVDSAGSLTDETIFQKFNPATNYWVVSSSYRAAGSLQSAQNY